MYLDDGLGIEEDDELCKAVVNQSTFIISYNLIGDHMKKIGLRQTTISNLKFFIQDIGIFIRQV
jgi:hypothetical protein